MTSMTNIQDIAIWILLVTGLLAFALTSIGVLLFRDFYDQIHFLSPGSLIGAVAIPLAVLLKEGFSQAGAKGMVIAMLLVLANPVLSHATARAARVRRKQQWMPTPEENVVVPQGSTK